MSSPANDHQYHGQGIRPLSLGLTWTLTVLAIIAVAVRFHLRIRFRKGIVIEDWIMLLALALQLVYQGIFTNLCYWGSGLPQSSLSEYQHMMINKWGFISAIPSILVSVIARISIGILLVRIFWTKQAFKVFVTVWTSMLALTGVLALSFLGASSRPWNGLWDPTVDAKKINLLYYIYTAVAIQFQMTISDLTYVLFPVLFIWKLNIRPRTKFAVVCLMSLSLVTMGIATAKLALVFIRISGNVEAIASTQRYYQSLVNLVAACEQCLVIALGCVPTLRLLSNLKLRFPSAQPVIDFTFWLVSLLPGSGSSRSRSRDRELSTVYDTSERPTYQDLERQKDVPKGGPGEITKEIASISNIAGTIESRPASPPQ